MANIIVCSRYPSDLQLEALINGEIQKFIVNGSKNEVYANKGEENSFLGAMAMTNIDEDLFNAWLTANKDSKLVTNNFIFTSKNTTSAKSQKKELKNEPTGFEGLSQESDKRAGGKKVKA